MKRIFMTAIVAMGLTALSWAQQFDELWATGSAVPNGTQQLVKRPDGQFRFAGALNAGEVKIMTTEVYQQGTTQFLKPQFVDSYLINNGLNYSVTTDVSQAGWVVLFQEDTYRFLIDPNARRLTGELMLPWNEVLIAGSAFPGGSDLVEWKRDNMLPFVRDHENPYVFTWEGELGVYNNVVEPGRFKLEGQMTWGPRELHPYVQDESILETTQMRMGGDDTKWNVSQQGTYRITVDLFNETIHAELIEASAAVSSYEGNDEVTAIESYDLYSIDEKRGRLASIYNLQGVRQPTLSQGMNIVKQADGSVSKVYIR